MVVLGRHVVYPRAAYGLALDGGLASQVVQIGNAGGKLGDGGIFVAVHDGPLPEALLALCEEQLRQGLEGVLVHVLGRVRHAKLGQHARLHVREYAGGLRKVVGSRLQALGCGVGSADGELRVERGEVVEDVHELVLEIVADHRAFGIIPQRRIPGEFSANLGVSAF